MDGRSGRAMPREVQLGCGATLHDFSLGVVTMRNHMRPGEGCNVFTVVNPAAMGGHLRPGALTKCLPPRLAPFDSDHQVPSANTCLTTTSQLMMLHPRVVRVLSNNAHVPNKFPSRLYFALQLPPARPHIIHVVPVAFHDRLHHSCTHR